jgi:O-antigen/teichoic acid export membrane protein
MNIRRSLAISLLSRYAQLMVSLASSVAIARLLTPEETGAFSLAMVLLSFTAVFRDFGASTYLAQAAEINAPKVQAVMGLQLLIGAVLASVAILASYPLAHWYSEPRMISLMPWVALSYLVSPFGTITQALLVRDMNFAAMARIQVGAGIVSAVVSVGFAAAGFGAVSLALGQFGMVLGSVLLGLPYRPRNLPLLPSLKGSAEVLGFGSAVTGTAIINVLVRGAPELLLGKLQGIASVGLFARGQGLVMMFGRQLTDAVASVAMPNFARLQREGQPLAPTFLHGTSCVCAAAWSSCGVIAVVAFPLVETLYGAQWREAVPLVKWVAGAYGIGLSVMLVSSALSARGQVKTIAVTTFASGSVTVVAAAIGAHEGLKEVGIALFLASLAHAAMFFGVAATRLGFSMRDLMRVLLRSAGVAACTVAAAQAALLVPKPVALSHWLDLLAGGSAGALGFCAAVFLVRHPLRTELQMLLGRLRRLSGA